MHAAHFLSALSYTKNRTATWMPVCVDELVSIFIDAVELIMTEVIHEFEFILGYHLENYEHYDTCRVQGLL